MITTSYPHTYPHPHVHTHNYTHTPTPSHTPTHTPTPTYTYTQTIDIKKVDKQLNVVYGTFRYERCSRNPLSGPLLFIYNNMYLSYIY